MAVKHYAGQTTPGQDWTPYRGGTRGLGIQVDTSAGEFDANPVYVTSVGGKSRQWSLVGTSTIYHPGRRSFVVYVHWRDNSPITPQDALDNGWYVNWIGYEVVG